MGKCQLVVLGIVVALLLGGCANSGPVQVSPGVYMITRQDRAGIFGNKETMKSNVIRDAALFAEKQGKVAIPITSHEEPLYPLHFATFEYQFQLVDKEDPRATNAVLLPRPDVVIDKKVSADIRTKDTTERPPDFYTELTKLDDLRKRGLLTDAEFEAQKQKLIGGK